MYIKCKGFCKICNNPLNPYIKSNDFEIRKIIRKYRKINPIFICNNDCFYKFFGLKLKRVCYSCFVRFKKPSMANIRDREIGAIKDLQEHKPLSLSSTEIYTWFINLQNYVKRHLKNCLL
jgi:hypothetical protein